MGSAALLRESLAQAVHYRDEKHRLDLQNMQAKLASESAAGMAGGDCAINMPQTAAQINVQTPDARKEALQPVLDGSMILKIHAHRADDILTAVRIADEFGLRYTLEHCTEGYRIADVLAKAYRTGRAEGYGCGIPGQGRLEGVITGPLLSDRSKPELVHADIRNPAILSAAGIPVAIMTDHPVIPEQYLAVSAAVACREGMDERLALAAITRTAACLAGAGDLIGTIEAGKQADLVLFSGHPFDYKTQVRRVWLDGRQVSHDKAGSGDTPIDQS
jgi:imidazolonepropionase-like amidohydrolase